MCNNVLDLYLLNCRYIVIIINVTAVDLFKDG